MSDLWAVVIAAGFVVAGFGLAVVAKRHFNVDNAGLSLSLLVVPFVIFLIASGRIQQFEGYGFKASFQALAGRSISEGKVGGTLISPEKPSLEAIAEMEQALVQLSGADNIVFLRADREHSRSERVRKALLIKNSLLAGTLRFVVVVDARGRPLGYFGPHTFLDLIPLQLEFVHRPGAGEPDNDAMLRAMMQTDYWDIVENPAERAEDWGRQLFLGPDETLAGAFRALHEAAAEGAVVTNRRGEYRGFVTRDRIRDQLMLALLDTAGNKD